MCVHTWVWYVCVCINTCACVQIHACVCVCVCVFLVCIESSSTYAPDYLSVCSGTHRCGHGLKLCPSCGVLQEDFYSEEEEGEDEEKIAHPDEDKGSSSLPEPSGEDTQPEQGSKPRKEVPYGRLTVVP